MKKKNKNNKGFTLVELLVVIAIIGILAVVAVPALFRNIEKAKIGDMEADINTIRSASLSYFADTNTYPGGDTTTVIAGENPADIEEVFAGELENISNPLDATYTLEGKSPEDLTLTIDFSTAKVSDKGLDILANSIKGIGTVDKNAQQAVVTVLKADGK